jgi:hypothetical protein
MSPMRGRVFARALYASEPQGEQVPLGYNGGMPPAQIRFHGTYRYRTAGELEDAVVMATGQLDDEDLSDPSLRALRTLVRRGSVLSVDIVVPEAADLRFAAANLFETLALRAVEGAVDADIGTRHVDWFPSGGEE